MGYLGWSISQQQVVSTEVVVSDEKVDGEDERVSLFRRSHHDDIYYAFLDHRNSSGNEHIVEGSILKLACLDALAMTVLTYSDQKKAC